MNITYEKCGDYLIPNLIPNPEPEGELRKFGLIPPVASPGTPAQCVYIL